VAASKPKALGMAAGSNPGTSNRYYVQFFPQFLTVIGIKHTKQRSSNRLNLGTVPKPACRE